VVKYCPPRCGFKFIWPTYVFPSGDFVKDIRYLISSDSSHSSVQRNKAASWLDENYTPSYLFIVIGAPHGIPKKAIDNLPIFQRNNAISTQDH